VLVVTEEVEIEGEEEVEIIITIMVEITIIWMEIILIKRDLHHLIIKINNIEVEIKNLKQTIEIIFFLN
jgi:hypothetical protein